MKLTSMKIDAKATEKESTSLVGGDRPAYPWGLQVRLDNEALEKLKIKDLPEVGAEMTLVAVVSVSSVSSHEDANTKKPHRHVELQITDLGLAPKVDKAAAETVLYEKA